MQIAETLDEEGRLEIVDDDQLYVLLGLRAEDEAAKQAREEAEAAAGDEARGADGDAANDDDMDTDGAAIPVNDNVPGERMVVHDSNKPSLIVGTSYPSMKEFRLAVRQFAINGEFELDLKATDPDRFIGGCKGAKNCPWHVNGRTQADKRTVTVFYCFYIFSVY